VWHPLPLLDQQAKGQRHVQARRALGSKELSLERNHRLYWQTEHKPSAPVREAESQEKQGLSRLLVVEIT
jgi:hypothetical protein